MSARTARTLLESVVSRIDEMIWKTGRLFSTLSSLCLFGMLVLVAATITLRPLDISFYWIWPWVMVLFVWLSFFGFLAAMVLARDIRVDFVARRFGNTGMTVTRAIGHVVLLFVLYWLLRELPDVVLKQSGKVDGALLPNGEELHRRYLSVPLLLSCIGIAIAVVVDLAKLFLGMPERLGGSTYGIEDQDPQA